VIVSSLGTLLNFNIGPIETLKHHKADIQEVSREMDFGLGLQNFEDIREGDLLQSVKHIELPGKL